MEIEFQHQNIALRVCMVIPLWFILAFIEYFFWGNTVNPFLFILISAIIMAFLAPILFKAVYGTFSFLIFHTGKACFFDETIVVVFNKRTKTIDKSTVSNAHYEQISLYGVKIDKMSHEYTIRGGHKALSLYSRDVIDSARDREFFLISQQLTLLGNK